MGIYLDSANPDEARRAQELGFVEGVTTNPKLIAQTGRPGLDVLAELTETDAVARIEPGDFVEIASHQAPRFGRDLARGHARHGRATCDRSARAGEPRQRARESR